LSNNINKETELDNAYTLDLIVNMIIEGFLEIKVAFMKNGIFHEKIGEIANHSGEKICFNGSMNETFSGYEINTESISVFNNWQSGIKQYANDITKRINNLWNNDAKGITVIDFTEALKHDLIRKYRISPNLKEAIINYKESKRKADIINENNSNYESMPLYDYQKAAIKEFKKYNYQHFYEMATGTGKTFTAIKTIEEVEKERGPIYVTVVVPSIDLQIQWYEEFLKAGYTNVQMLGGYKSNTNWRYDFERSLIEFEDQDILNGKSIVYIAVSDSYFDKMVSEITNIRNYMIIID